MKQLDEVTWNELEAEVRRLAAENPDYRYPRMINEETDCPACFYTATASENTTGAVCIFGQALANVGIPAPTLLSHEGRPIHALLWHESFNEIRREWIQGVQDQQDQGQTWSHAVDTADACYGDLDVH